MPKHQPNPNRLDIQVKDSPDDAVHWNRDCPDVRAVDLAEAHIVCRGTEHGLATVDFVLVDNEGNRNVAMLTGSLVRQLALVIEAAEAK